MKHISSKLIVMTILLTVGLLLVTAFLSFSVLKKESRAYTFQGQLLKTQLFSEAMRSELARVNEVAIELIQLKPDSGDFTSDLKNFYEKYQKSVDELKGVAIGMHPESGVLWLEYPAKSVTSVTLPADNKNKLMIPASEGSSEFVILIPAKNVTLAIRIDLKKNLQNCVGTDVAFFNQAGRSIYFCNPESRSIFEKASLVVSEAFHSSLDSGTLERDVGKESYLWTFSNVLDYGKVISESTSKDAYSPAYSLAIRIAMLIVMAIGAAIVTSILVARRLTGPIEEVTRATQAIASGDFDARIVIKTRDETRTLAQSVESMAQKIKHLIQSEVEKAKLDAQLEVAGTVQRTLIPERKLDLGKLHINSYYHPADQCGGDWWGYVQSANKVAILIGDVSGHGYASALLVATTRGFLSMLQDRINRDQNMLPPDEILNSLNGVVFDATRSELNMTALCFVLDLDTGNYEISNAGHNAPYKIEAGNSVNSLHIVGPRLGEGSSLSEPLEIIRGKLEPTDKLVLFTDGVQDVGTIEHPLGRKGFKNFIQNHMTVSSDDLILAVEEKLFPMNEGRPLVDDITFVVIERNA